VSERTLLLNTLEVESERLTQAFAASVRRETIMKGLFLTHYRAAQAGSGTKPKAIDQRGVSTLGNSSRNWPRLKAENHSTWRCLQQAGRFHLAG
jgi:hypothetical protein